MPPLLLLALASIVLTRPAAATTGSRRAASDGRHGAGELRETVVGNATVPIAAAAEGRTNVPRHLLDAAPIDILGRVMAELRRSGPIKLQVYDRDAAFQTTDLRPIALATGLGLCPRRPADDACISCCHRALQKLLAVGLAEPRDGYRVAGGANTKMYAAAVAVVPALLAAVCFVFRRHGAVLVLEDAGVIADLAAIEVRDYHAALPVLVRTGKLRLLGEGNVEPVKRPGGGT